MKTLLHRVQASVFADYFQFYLWDQRANPRAPDEWSDQDVSNRLKTAPNVVVVCPVRNMIVPVTLELHEQDPGYVADRWDHIAECSLDIPSGHLALEECTGQTKASMEVQAASYRVRAHFAGLTSLSEDGLDGNDHYLVTLWPAPSAPLIVIKIGNREAPTSKVNQTFPRCDGGDARQRLSRKPSANFRASGPGTSGAGGGSPTASESFCASTGRGGDGAADGGGTAGSGEDAVTGPSDGAAGGVLAGLAVANRGCEAGAPRASAAIVAGGSLPSSALCCHAQAPTAPRPMSATTTTLCRCGITLSANVILRGTRRS
jgi:hypothetical protein